MNEEENITICSDSCGECRYFLVDQEEMIFKNINQWKEFEDIYAPCKKHTGLKVGSKQAICKQFRNFIKKSRGQGNG